MGDLYSWLKTLHVISIIAWMAGLLYRPRLYVYHCQAPVGSAQSEMLKTMERRLLRAIMNPAMIAAWVLAYGWQRKSRPSANPGSMRNFCWCC